jgi:hypothetical protein
MTGRVRDMIIDSRETGKLGEAIGDGSYYGMQTFDQALLHLHTEGKISMDAALKAATHPHDFKLLVASGGQRSSGVEQVFSPEHKSVSEAPPGEQRRREADERRPQRAANGRPPAGPSGGPPPVRSGS